MILISGATGGIGSEICRLLGQAGTPFRAMARQQAQVDAYRKKDPMGAGWRRLRQTDLPALS